MKTLTQFWPNENTSTQEEMFHRQVTLEPGDHYNDDEEESVVDMTQKELEDFTQHHAEPDYDIDGTKDYASQSIDFSQDENNDNVVYEQDNKRSRLSKGKKKEYRDTAEEWFLGKKGFKKDASFCLHHENYPENKEPEKIFTIKNFYMDYKTNRKMADCLVRVLIRKTFLAKNYNAFERKKFEENFGKYACQRMSVRIKLCDLATKFEKKLPDPKIYYDAPPMKAFSNWAGWTVAYSFTENFSEGDTIDVTETPCAIDLFAGAGGMSIALKAAGFEISHAVDNNPYAEATLDKNHRNETLVLGQTVESFIQDAIEENRYPKEVSSAYSKTLNISHCHASSPCQGFSKANTTGSEDLKNKNNKLSETFVDAMISLDMQTGTFENVSGMLQPKCLHYLQKMMGRLLLNHFQVRVCVLDSSQYGDAQKRIRVIMFVSRKGWKLPEKPTPTHGKGKIPLKTVKEAIGDLESVEPRNGPGLVRLPNKVCYVRHHIKSDRQVQDKDILWAHKPAHTIICSHPVGHYNRKRACTNLEVARLQGFPDSWVFCGSEAAVRKQIGNAVPIGLGTAVAKEMFKVYKLKPKCRMKSKRSAD